MRSAGKSALPAASLAHAAPGMILPHRPTDSTVEQRLAYTAGCVVVVVGDGKQRRIPAGACWIGRAATGLAGSTVRWKELGIDWVGHMSSADLRSHLLGCIIQYA